MTAQLWIMPLRMSQLLDAQRRNLWYVSCGELVVIQ